MIASAAGYPTRPRRRWIWACVAVVTAFILVAPVAFRMGLKSEIRHQIVPLTLIQRPISQLWVDAPGQSVTVIRGRGGQVRVISTVSWLLGSPTVNHAWHGETLRISASCPSVNLFDDCQVGLVIQVPANVAVRVAVGSGSAAVAGLTGPVRLTATSGSIHLTDVSGPVWATTTSGRIVATSGLRAPRVTAAVGSGRLILGFTEPPEALALDVGSGAARVTVPPGARYRVSGERGSGSLLIGPGLADNRAARVITATVGSGLFSIGYLQPAPPTAPTAPPAS
jgi:hypothetical protein